METVLEEDSEVVYGLSLLVREPQSVIYGSHVFAKFKDIPLSNEVVLIKNIRELTKNFIDHVRLRRVFLFYLQTSH